MPQLLQGIARFEAAIDKEPSKRTFGGLERGENGAFSDEQLVKILKESIEDPAGMFLNHRALG